MTPLQLKTVEFVKDYGKPISARALAKLTGRSHAQVCNLLKVGFDERLLTRVRNTEYTNGLQWEYSVPKAIRVFGMDVRLNR
jgi:hypothetical protein